MKELEYAYRSVDEWRRAMIMLDDDAFFTLMSGTTGNIKTPFNKQKLTDELQAFFSRADVQETIDALIDENDIEILAAISLLKAPEKHDLIELLSGSANHIVLHNRIQNMEERLLIYRSSDDETVVFNLNPLLAPILNKYKADYAYLLPAYTLDNDTFSGIPPEPGENHFFSALFGDAVLAAALRFFPLLQSPFRGDGLWKKKSLEEFEQVFGKIDADTYISTLAVLELISKTENGIEAHEQKITAFAALNVYERRVYCAAALFMHKTGAAAPAVQTVSSYFERVSVAAAASFISSLMHCLTDDARVSESSSGRRVFPARTLKRIMFLLRKDFTEQYINTKIFARNEETLFSTLCAAGLLRRVQFASGAPDPLDSVYYTPADMFAPPAAAAAAAGAAGAGDGAAAANAAVITFNGAFSCMVSAKTAFSDALKIALAGELRAVDIPAGAPFIHYEITRLSVNRALDAGLSAGGITEMLKCLSGDTQDDALLWSVREWARRASEVAIYDTLCITLSAEQQFAAQTPALAKLIFASPAPGVLILNTKNKKTALDALSKCGIDTVSTPQDAPAKTRPILSLYYGGYPRLSSYGAFPLGRGGIDSKPGSKSESVNIRKQRLLASLSAMPFPEAQKESFKAKIDKRLIVSVSQFEGIKVSGEKLEARGLDYIGKIALAKQALEAKDLVEIEMNGAEERILVKPVSIGKRENDTVMSAVYMNEADKDDRKNVSLPFGKIKYIRWLKKSSFL